MATPPSRVYPQAMPIRGLGAILLTLSACASQKPLPPCPAADPPDHELVTPAELELPADQRMPEGATPPERIASPAPVLPEDAFANSTGPEVVIVKYRVDAEGAVSSAEVTRGQAPFSETAVAAVKQMKFRPASHEGRPIAVHQVRRFVFRHSYAHCQEGSEQAPP